jgi:hypothetical protein
VGPEIPEAWHPALIYFAVHRAYLKDFDRKEPDKAQTFLALYEEQVALAKGGAA